MISYEIFLLFDAKKITKNYFSLVPVKGLKDSFNLKRQIQEIFPPSPWAPFGPILLKDKFNDERLVQEVFCASMIAPSEPMLLPANP